MSFESNSRRDPFKCVKAVCFQHGMQLLLGGFHHSLPMVLQRGDDIVWNSLSLNFRARIHKFVSFCKQVRSSKCRDHPRTDQL